MGSLKSELKNFAKMYFLTAGRLKRLGFIKVLLLISSPIFLSVFLMQEITSSAYATLFSLTLKSYYLIWLYMVFVLLVKRFHDFNKSGLFMFFVYLLLGGLVINTSSAFIFTVTFSGFEEVVYTNMEPPTLEYIGNDQLQPIPLDHGQPDPLDYTLSMLYVIIFINALWLAIPSLIPGSKEENRYG